MASHGVLHLLCETTLGREGEGVENTLTSGIKFLAKEAPQLVCADNCEELIDALRLAGFVWGPRQISAHPVDLPIIVAADIGRFCKRSLHYFGWTVPSRAHFDQLDGLTRYLVLIVQLRANMCRRTVFSHER